MQQNLATMRGVVDELKKSYTAAREKSNRLADQIATQIELRAQAPEAEKKGGFFSKV
jgi:hypothetical protein